MATPTPVIFSLVDSENSRYYSRLYISPISYPLVYSGSIVIGDTISTLTSEAGPIATVNLIPNQYEVRCIGEDSSYETQYYISVPSSSIPVSASAILYNIQDFTAHTTASYAISASHATTASYALNGGGGGSSVWTQVGNDIYNTNTGTVNISSSNGLVASSVYINDLSPTETVLIGSEFKQVVASPITSTELNNLSGVTSNIQDQLNTKYSSGSVIQTPYIDLTVDGSPTYAQGRLFYDATQHTLCVYNDQPAVTLNLGEENWVRVVNKTAATITNGSAVTISGSIGNRPQAILAQSTQSSGSNAYGIIGIATQDIDINQEGMVTVLGAVRSINTSGFNSGDSLYVSSSAGKITNIKPAVGWESIKIGIALNSTVNGSIFVSPVDCIHATDISGYGDLTITNNQANVNINTIPSNSYGRLVFRDNGTERVAIQFLNNQFDAYYSTSGRSNALEIYNNTGSTIFFNSGSERCRFTKDGSVIIGKPGTTSSAYQLEVMGTVSASAYTASNAGFYCPGNTANSGLKVGSLEFQGFSVNNCWQGDNVYYQGSNFVARVAGYVSLFYYQSPECQFRISSASLSAGATWTPSVISKMYGVTQTVALGGNMSTVAGNFTNAVLYVSGSGKVGINTTTPTAALEVNGSILAVDTVMSVPLTGAFTGSAGSFTGSYKFFQDRIYVYNGSRWTSASLA